MIARDGVNAPTCNFTPQLCKVSGLFTASVAEWLLHNGAAHNSLGILMTRSACTNSEWKTVRTLLPNPFVKLARLLYILLRICIARKRHALGCERKNAQHGLGHFTIDRCLHWHGNGSATLRRINGELYYSIQPWKTTGIYGETFTGGECVQFYAGPS